MAPSLGDLAARFGCNLGDLATKFGCELRGDADVQIESVASLHNADSSSLSFLSSPAFKEQLASTNAAAVILRAENASLCPTACLINENPYASYARMAAEICPAPQYDPGVHASATVASSAKVAASAHIAANAVVGDRSIIGEKSYVGPGCVIGPDCVIGDDCRFIANVTVVRNVVMGARCLLHPGVVIGTDGFGNAQTPEGWVKVPQLGGIRVGDDVEIGANSAIDCGALDDSIIENGVRIDNLVHIAHNIRIGEHTAIAAKCGFAGSVTIGKRCMFAGNAGAVGQVTICDDVIVSALGMVTKDITEPGVYASSFAAEPARDWNRNVANVRRLGSLKDRVKKLEKDAK
jgi:UDP-3-O-[3-hydroxymyristoyl] glucosamine N-acyltransferase